MSKLVYRHDRAGYAGELRFSVTSDADAGAVGASGVGAARNLPDGNIDDEGYATAAGGGEYVMAGSQPGVNTVPPPHRLTVRMGATPIATVAFRPVETAPGIIDVLQLIQGGQALALTPEQVAELDALIARTIAAAERAEQAGPGTPGLSGTQAQRRAYDRSRITVKTRWDVSEAPYPTYWYTPGDTSWRDSSGNNPDAAPPPPDTGVY